MLILATETHFGVAPTRRSALYRSTLFQTNEQIAPVLENEDDRTPGRNTPPHERIHRLQFIFEWAQILEIAAVEPWPALRIEWRHRRIVDRRTFEPRRTWFHGEANEGELARDMTIVALFERIDALGVEVPVRRGWAAAEHVEWIDDPDWPTVREEGRGAYRTDAQKRIVATRPKPSPSEFLLAWLAAGPRQPWSATPREVVVTRDHIHARLAKGRTVRLPLSTLRTRRGGEAEDAVYVFGRRTPLVLPYREGCEVRRQLDVRLSDVSGASRPR